MEKERFSTLVEELTYEQMGHMYRKHFKVTELELFERLCCDDNLMMASAYRFEGLSEIKQIVKTERIIKQTLLGNYESICSFLENSSIGARKTIGAISKNEIGYCFSRERKSMNNKISCKTAIVVIEKSKTSLGFTIITSFPRPTKKE